MAFALGACIGVLMTRVPSAAKTASKETANLVPRSRRRNLTAFAWLASPARRPVGRAEPAAHAATGTLAPTIAGVSCNPRHQTVAAPRLDVDPATGTARARQFQQVMARRRTVRDFAPTPVPREIVHRAIEAAASAPSGANIQPWRFVVVADPEIKRRIREGAEAEERAFYDSRASAEWLDALAPLGTDWRKPFLQVAPYLIVVFEVHKGPNSPRPYYVKESVGIAVGFLIAALHHAGLATVTHTPSPMRWLNEVLGRPAEERPHLMIPVGYPAGDAEVPDVHRKPLNEVLVEL